MVPVTAVTATGTNNEPLVIPLEVKLSGELPFTRRPRSGRSREPQRIHWKTRDGECRRCASGHQELRVVEDLECFSSQLQIEGAVVVEIDILHQRQVCLISTRQSRERATRVSKRSHRVH